MRIATEIGGIATDGLRSDRRKGKQKMQALCTRDAYAIETGKPLGYTNESTDYYTGINEVPGLHTVPPRIFAKFCTVARRKGCMTTVGTLSGRGGCRLTTVLTPEGVRALVKLIAKIANIRDRKRQAQSYSPVPVPRPATLANAIFGAKSREFGGYSELKRYQNAPVPRPW